MNNNSNNKYDPNVIIQAARETMLASAAVAGGDEGASASDLARGQMIFQQALMDWTDDCRESIDNNDPSADVIVLQEAIATLWIAYAQFLSNAAQYKSTFDAYEQAVQECGGSTAASKIYLEYARFAEERNKFKIAQDVYIRALVRKQQQQQDMGDGTMLSGAIQDEQDRHLLWNEFLEMMRTKTDNPNLTITELQQAVEEKEKLHEQKQRQLEGEDSDETESDNDGSDEEDNTDEGERSSKRLKKLDEEKDGSENNDPTNEGVDVVMNDATKSSTTTVSTATIPKKDKVKKAVKSASTSISKTHVVLSDSIEQEANTMLRSWGGENRDDSGITKRDKLLPISSSNDEQKYSSIMKQLPSNVMAAWMIIDGNEPPSIPDPLLFQSTTPKLSDPTAKDILGIDLSLRLIQRLLEPSGNMVLEVCHGLWTLQALKHKETSDELEELDSIMLAEHEQFEGVLEARLSGASSNDNITLKAAVEQMNRNERNNFQSTCSTKRLTLLQKIAWEFRRVLFIQQIILSQLNVPGFTNNDNHTKGGDDDDGSSSTIVDTAELQLQSLVCKYLHSAFYIRNRMGTAPHESMLKSQLKRLEKERNDPTSLSPKVSSSSAGGQPPPPPPSGMMMSNGNPQTTSSPIPPSSGMSYDFAYQQHQIPQPVMAMASTQPSQYMLQPQLAPPGGQSMMAVPPMDYQMHQPYLPQPMQPQYVQQPPSMYQPGYVVQQQPGVHQQQPQYYYPSQQAPGMMMMNPQQQQQQSGIVMQQQQYIPGYGQPPTVQLGQQQMYQQPPQMPNAQQQQYPYYQQ